MKELIQRILAPFLPPEIRAYEGTLKYKFLAWLYGNGEPEFPFVTFEDAE